MAVETVRKTLDLGGQRVGDGQPIYVIAEIGINHNGSVDIAKAMIDGCVKAGANAVKFQKRTPEQCVPKHQWEVERDTPWGRMTYIEYRRRIEFSLDDYKEIDRYCRERNIQWTASCWDQNSVDFMMEFNPPFFKAPSASLTDLPLLQKMHSTGRPLMISTGMSEWSQILAAVDAVGCDNLLIAHSTSAYPCPVDILNLRMITTLRDKFPEVPVGYSGHETGLAPTWGAVALGASFLERHVTLDRAMWGTDQAASVEMGGLGRLVSNVRDLEKALGDGVKRVYEQEIPVMRKLRIAT